MTNLHILYVEDEPDIRMIGKRSMQSIGKFVVKECASGHDALAAVASFTPDVLVLDVMMPYMNGPETLQKLRALPVTASTPVIFMTAKVQANEVSEYMALGAIGVIAKPFEPMSLAQQITDMLARHRQESAA